MFKVKKDEHGAIVKHKTRLVAKGYVQREGVDFEEVFAPVARLESVRLILAVAAHRGWEVHHMDVKSAFLNCDLNEEVYVSHPPGFVAKGHEQGACHVAELRLPCWTTIVTMVAQLQLPCIVWSTAVAMISKL